MMAARMGMMGGQPGMGMNGLPGPGRGPVPPPKPPPRSPPSRPNQAELMQMMMKMGSARGMSDMPRSEEELLMRALEMSRGRSPRRDRRYRCCPAAFLSQEINFHSILSQVFLEVQTCPEGHEMV